MFEEIAGIPAHPLIVHGAVVLVPLLILAAVGYAVLPFLRRHIWWAAVGLAVVAPLAAWAAVLSGKAFRQRLVDRGASDATFLGKIDEHMSYGDLTAYLATALGVVTLVVVLALVRPPALGGGTGGSTVLTGIAALVVIGLAVAAGYYVFLTGDTGAHIVWSGQ